MPRSSTERTTQDNYTPAFVFRSFPSQLWVGGWVGLGGPLRTKMVYSHAVQSPIEQQPGLTYMNFVGVVQCYCHCVKLPPNTNYDHGCNRASAISAEIVTSDKCLQGEGLVWLTGVVVCLLAATAGPMSVSAGNGWLHLHCSTTGSWQSTATSEIVKRAVLVRRVSCAI